MQKTRSSWDVSAVEGAAVSAAVSTRAGPDVVLRLLAVLLAVVLPHLAVHDAVLAAEVRGELLQFDCSANRNHSSVVGSGVEG